MSPERTCPDCGATLPADAPRGLCPECLMGAALPRTSTGGSATTGGLEPAGMGVLATIAQSIGPVPRVLLRDTAPGEEPGPIVRPPAGDDDDRSIRYRIDGEIARGGMGAVLKGRDPDLGRDVALKVLRDDLRDNADMVRRFVEEAQIGGQLQHPGVVPIYELGTFADRRPFFAMKLVKGHTLAQLLEARTDPADDRPRFLSIFEAIAQTVAFAHARGVIHRDLKPSNVMVGSFGEVQVMDWGLAKVLPRGGAVDDARAGKEPPAEALIATARSRSDQELSHAGSILGTPSYMATEQARGETDRINERADVFALGSILGEILTGSPAFTGRTSTEILRKAAQGDTADALARLDGCGAEAELITLARDCLTVEPDDRPRDANVVAERITAYLSGVQERVHAAERERAVAVARAIEERRRRKVQLALAASVLAFTTLGGLSTTYYLQQRAERARQRMERAAATDRVVGQAVTLRDQARSNPEDLARWQVALAAVKQAEAAHDEGAAPRLLALRNEFQTGLDAAERDKALLDHLVDIRLAEADDRDGSATDAAYADAFRGAGIDLASVTPAEAGEKIKARQASVVLGLAGALDDWASIRRGKRGNPGGAAQLSEAACVADPDPWRKDLRTALDQSDKSALRALAKTANFHELGPTNLHLLGTGLNDAGDSAGAESVLRKAQERHPRDVWINYELGKILEKLSRPDEAIRFYTAARSIRPETAHELAHALEKRGDSDEAIAVFRDLIELRPGIAGHLGCLTERLAKEGKLDEIIAVLRTRKRLEPTAKVHVPVVGTRHYHIVSVDEAIARYPAVVAHYRFTLGSALKNQGKLDEAAAAYREAIRLEPNHAQAYSGLVLVLKAQGKLDEAAAAYREAIRLKPDNAEAHFHLGGFLRAQGDYAGSLAMFQAGHELGTKQPGWRHPSAQWVADAERQADLAQRLTAVLNGEDRPKDNAERLSLASMCQESNRFAAAARLTAEALESEPELGDDLNARHRHHAIARAALAGLGQGVDDPRPDLAARKRFLTLAREWLRADLGLCSKKLDVGNAMDPGVVMNALQHWKECPDLSGIRDAEALAKLPADERKEWQALWARVPELELRANDLTERFRAKSARVPVPELKTAVPTSNEPSIGSPDRETLMIGDEAPAISVSKWVKGQPVDRLDSKKTYVVEFWATWCGPCRTSIPHLTELQRKYKDKGITFIGVSVDQNQDAVAPFVKEMGDKMDYSIAIDEVPRKETGSKPNMAESWMQAADQYGIPTAFIVREGKVAWIGHPMAMDEALEKCSAREFDIEVTARPYRETKERQKRLALSQVAYDHKQFALATRILAEALARDPMLGENRQTQLRYKAARAAALAAAGQAVDEPPLDDAAKTKLRGQALDWLKADLTVWSKLFDSGPLQDRASVVAKLSDWQHDTALAGIRDAAALAKLPPQEQKEWQALWARVPELATVVPISKEQGQKWRYTTKQPPDGWQMGDFDDNAWQEGVGGFGRNGRSETVVRTEWKIDDIWLRREFTMREETPDILELRVIHDDDAEVYVNGVLALKLPASSYRGYEDVPISAEAWTAMKSGKNVVAVHCHQKEGTGGSQYIDVGIVAVKGNAGRLAFAQLAYGRKQFAVATRHFAEALASDPKLGDDRQTRHRDKAARAAALAAAGQGKDEPPLDDAAKTKLRRQAVDWLKAELAFQRKQLESGKPGDRAEAEEALLSWQTDGDLAGLREATALANLPANEQKECRQLWAAVRDLLMKAQGNANSAPFRLPGVGRPNSWMKQDREGKWLAVPTANKVAVFDARTGALVRTLTGHTDRVYSIAFSLDGRFLAGGTCWGEREVGTVKVWDLTTGMVAETLASSVGILQGITFSGDGKRLFGSGPGGIQMWELTGKRLVRTFAMGQGGKSGSWNRGWYGFFNIGLSPDGKRVVCHDTPTTIKVWDIEGDRPPVTLGGYRSYPTNAMYSPEGRLLATGSDVEVLLWDASTLKLVKRIATPAGWLAFDPDGKSILTAQHDMARSLGASVVTRWDLATYDGKPLPPLTGRTGWPAYYLSPDGKRLYTQVVDGPGAEGRIRVYDAATGADVERVRRLALATRLPALLRGEEKPADNSERLAFAGIAYDQKQYAAATRLWVEALASDPSLGDDRQAQLRYDAARAAALAAAGQGQDEVPLDDAEKARLRKQALDLLKAELNAWSNLRDSDPLQDRRTMMKQMLQWQKDTELASLRDATALAQLPADEQEEWQALWARMPVRAVVPTSKEEGQMWRYTTRQPANDWQKADFDDKAWQEGMGGFGDRGNLSSVRTEWTTGHIWLRREFTMPEGTSDDLLLLVNHDDDAEVYVNGVLAVKAPRDVFGYEEMPISAEARKVLKPGKNLVAVHCHRTYPGWQYIDVGITAVK